MNQQSSAEALAHALLHGAARRAPPQLRARLEEEWLADLATRRGALARLRFALGCRWAARTIALEFGVPVRTAALRVATATATAAGPAVVPLRPSAPQGSPRILFLMAILGFHGLIIYALAAGLTHEGLGDAIPPPLRPTFIERHPPAISLPVPNALVLTAPRVVVPVPLFNLDGPREAPAIVAATVTQSAPALAAAASAGPARRVLGGPGAGFPDAEVYYPENLRRLGREGAATVRVCVDARGRLTQAPQIGESSGNALFDDSALRLARAGSGRYRATLEDGKPVDSCYPFRVRFQMR